MLTKGVRGRTRDLGIIYTHMRTHTHKYISSVSLDNSDWHTRAAVRGLLPQTVQCVKRGFGTRGSPLERQLLAGYFETLSWPHVGPNADSRVVAGWPAVQSGRGQWTPGLQRCSVAQSCPTLCNSMECSMPGFSVLRHLQKLAQLMSIESVIQSNHLILCRPLLLLP